MGTLIERVRLMVGDPVIAGTPTTSVFTDQQIQDILDHHRVDVLQVPLIARSTITPTGYQWLDYQARWGFWEDDVVINDATWATITAEIAGTPPTAVYTADLLTGHWTFVASQLPTLYITGRTYDLYGAAVEVLEAWQGILRAAGEIVSFSEDGQSFTRAQKGSGMAATAQEYRRKALPAGPRWAADDRW